MLPRLPFFIGACATLFAGHVSATTIAYTATSLGGNGWRYDYVVTNDTLDRALEEFTVYFALGSYVNLRTAIAPAEWDALVVQPDADLPAPGFYDALALSGGIAPGMRLSGFAASFDYLGVGVPGAQSFEVVDPSFFDVLSAGTTTAVPAPGAGGLLATGLLAGAARLRRRASVLPGGTATAGGSTDGLIP